jgi:hypothetical protein
MKSYFHISYSHLAPSIFTVYNTKEQCCFTDLLTMTSCPANSQSNVFPYNATTDADENNKSQTINPHVYIKSNHKMTL